MRGARQERETDGGKIETAGPELQPRSRRHARTPLRAVDIVNWLLAPLHVAPLEASMLPRHRYARPRELPETSRSRRRRRAVRLRLARRIRFVRALRRAVWSGAAGAALLDVAFWAKFAVVYNVPNYAQTGPLQGAAGYVVFKTWWFGPPSFDLADYAVNASQPLASLETQLERYQGIVTNPGEIVWIWYRNHAG